MSKFKNTLFYITAASVIVILWLLIRIFVFGQRGKSLNKSLEKLGQIKRERDEKFKEIDKPSTYNERIASTKDWLSRYNPD